MKNYWYFISYKHANEESTGFGNCELPLNMRITSIEHICAIQRAIEDKFNFTGVSIDNFILIRETDS